MSIAFKGNHIKDGILAATTLIGVSGGSTVTGTGILTTIVSGAAAVLTAPALPFVIGGAAVVGTAGYAIKKAIDKKEKSE